MTASVYYRIPKKRKYCVITYDNKYYQSIDDLRKHLSAVGFSSPVIDMIVTRVMQRQVSATEMEDTLKELGTKKTNITKIMKGVVVKA